MAGWKDFREIVAWQRAESVKLRVYSFLERPKVKRDFRLCGQLREAARSAPANIAEGFGRFGNKEFARFVRIARGSETEVLNHFIDAKDQRLLTEDELLVEEHHVRGALKAAAGLIQHLESTPDPPRPKKQPRTQPNLTLEPGTMELWNQESEGARFQPIGFFAFCEFGQLKTGQNAL